MRSLGVDVSVVRGLDLVLLDATRRPIEVHRRVRVEDLGALLGRLRPQIVAIDSPPAWGLAGASRRAERELRRLGLSSYATPSDPLRRERRFYEWMKVGFRVFARAAASGFHLFRQGRIRRTAIEVYPYATAVTLAGGLRPRSIPKTPWRTEVLRRQGVPVEKLRSIDEVDAALAALTGLHALQGRYTTVGNPGEGVIVLPIESLPARPYAQALVP